MQAVTHRRTFLDRGTLTCDSTLIYDKDLILTNKHRELDGSSKVWLHKLFTRTAFDVSFASVHGV